MTTWPAFPDPGLMSRSPACSSVFWMGVECAARPAVSRPGPGRPRAIEAYPEQSRRYPSNHVVESLLDRYGTGPPPHPVNHVAARVNTAIPSRHPGSGLDWPSLLKISGQLAGHCSRSSGIVRRFAEPTADTSRVASDSQVEYASGNALCSTACAAWATVMVCQPWTTNR